MPSVVWVELLLKVFPDWHVQGERYVIDEGVEVIATPGHTGADVSLTLQNTTHGTVLVAGKCLRQPALLSHRAFQAVCQYY